ISEGIKEELIKQGFNKNKIIVFHDGVDLEKFNIKISQSEARKKLNLPLDNNVIIYVGSLQDWKGTPTLLSASKSFEKNTLLCIVGGNKDQILKLKTNYKNVLFKGNVINELIPFYLKAANILVLPNSSKFEISTKYTSPLKLFEYMASKKPIIASKLQSIKNIVSEKEVLFFKPDDSKDLNKQISSLLKNSKSQKELSENAFKKVKNFTWIERVKEILKVLKK
ncbi:MAG: glycosyltransferase, partial [Candidatus Woesearchaeota archaeon]